MSAKKKVLIMDDDPSTGMILKSKLKNANFEIIYCSHIKDGWQVMELQKPQLIVLDIKMPEMDGYTFLRRLKKSGSEYKDIPVIILTAYEGMRDMFEVEGIHDYLVKPVNVEAFHQSVQSCFSKNSEVT